MKKATFNKANDVYPHGSLREQPEPSREPKGKDYELSGEYLKAWANWKNSSRVIPCSENNWKDRQGLEEGKDYKLEECFDKNMISEIQGYDGKFLFAVPIVQETEDELWGEVKEILKESWVADSFIKKLKSKFTIQRRKQ